MIAQERPPALRRRAPSPCHVLSDRGLPDIDAELEQFPVYSGCAPKWVCDAHLANESADVRGRDRPAAVRSRFPAPIGSEPSTVPAHSVSGLMILRAPSVPGARR